MAYVKRAPSAFATMAFSLLIPLILSGMTATENAVTIDRQALVMRHAIERDHVDKDPRSALQVGNGEFAFNADETGLQTFHGCQPALLPMAKGALMMLIGNQLAKGQV